ncbi:MAG: PLP-dependent aminotransferase family protein [Desulfobacterales bacterium]|jgi:DNA-binding transcriptional MocR family regulator
MDPSKRIFRYRHLAEEIEQKILSGTYHPGERLPSIRKMHKQSSLSISTIYHAYLELESMGLVEARPKSGYYVNPVALQNLKIPRFKKASFPPKKVRLSSMINSVISAISNPYFLPLGSTVVDANLMPFKHFSRILKTLSHVDLKSMISYSPSEGYAELRRQIALRTVGVLEGIAPEDIIITNGCMEAVALSLLAVARPGDTIAVETPTNFGFLQLLQELGLMVMEVPADPRYGVDIGELEKIFCRNTIKACLLIPNFHNPLGALMPDDHKVRLIQLINQYGVAVIEDDISSELHFGRKRPMPLKSYDTQDRVLTCSSFSKSLAAGLRIGWLIPGKRYMEKIQNLKAATTVSTSTLDQYLISQYLAEGAFERHVRRLRHSIKKQVVRTAFAIQKHFPPATRLAIPDGGTLLWVELPPQVDGLQVYRRALENHIAIIPGEVCSNSRQFHNFIQIGCGSPFTEVMEKGIMKLGEIVSDLLRR